MYAKERNMECVSMQGHVEKCTLRNAAYGSRRGDSSNELRPFSMDQIADQIVETAIETYILE